MAAYMVAICTITNFKPELKEYAQKSAELMRKQGGRYIVRGNAAENHEGDLLAVPSVIVAEFPSMEHLKGFIASEEYQNNIKPLRDGTGEYHIAFYEELPAEAR